MAAQLEADAKRDFEFALKLGRPDSTRNRGRSGRALRGVTWTSPQVGVCRDETQVFYDPRH